MTSKVLKTAKEIIPLFASKTKGRYVFAKPLQGNEAKEVYEEVKERIEKDFQNASAFNAYFHFNKQTGEINGSSDYYGILISQILSRNGLWLPTLAQAKKLDKSGRLSNGVYRYSGIAVYSNDAPNQETAKRLIEQAEQRGWKLPILASFKSLDLTKPAAEIILSDNLEEVITGDEARQYLDEEFNYKRSSGACGFGRNQNGSWNAGWYLFGYSGEGGRVDFACGEATQKNLEAVYEKMLKEKYEAKTKELEDAKKQEQNDFLESLRNL